MEILQHGWKRMVLDHDEQVKPFPLRGNRYTKTSRGRRRLVGTEDGDEMQKALRIEQSLFFTIYKSEW
jgi:hypothetical protein